MGPVTRGISHQSENAEETQRTPRVVHCLPSRKKHENRNQRRKTEKASPQQAREKKKKKKLRVPVSSPPRLSQRLLNASSTHEIRRRATSPSELLPPHPPRVQQPADVAERVRAVGATPPLRRDGGAALLAQGGIRLSL